MKTLLNGYGTPALPTCNQSQKGKSNFERMLNRKNTDEEEEEDEDEDEEEGGGGRGGRGSGGNTNGEIEPLRPATCSALFRPKRMSPSKMTRGSRASLLPLGLTRLGSRKMLKGETAFGVVCTLFWSFHVLLADS